VLILAQDLPAGDPAPPTWTRSPGCTLDGLRKSPVAIL
jgi:hypothetical protein